MNPANEMTLPGAGLLASKMPGHWLLARLGKRVLRPGGLEMTRTMVPPSDIAAILKKLEHEHDQAGDALARFKVLSDNYTLPEWACNTFRALYDELAHLEQDTHRHVHKENNVLFPKVLAAA